MNKHTPGPWTLETVRTSCGICHKIGPEETVYACIYVDNQDDHVADEKLANAHLIAAAPDLLASAMACVKLLEELAHDGAENPELQQARAAIANTHAG